MNGPDAQRYTEDTIKGWKDPAPYPFVLAGVTPSLGTEHLIVPAGAGHLGVFSLASGLMVHSFNLPGVGNDDIAAMTTLRNPNPTGEVSSAFVPTKGAAGGGWRVGQGAAGGGDVILQGGEDIRSRRGSRAGGASDGHPCGGGADDRPAGSEEEEEEGGRGEGRRGWRRRMDILGRFGG